MVSGEDIARERRRQGLSQTELGQQIQVGRSAVSNIERGIVEDSGAFERAVDYFWPEGDAPVEQRPSGDTMGDLSDAELLARAQRFLAELATRLHGQPQRGVATPSPRDAPNLRTGPLDDDDRPATDTGA